jgi:hypothetical protein
LRRNKVDEATSLEMEAKSDPVAELVRIDKGEVVGRGEEFGFEKCLEGGKSARFPYGGELVAMFELE